MTKPLKPVPAIARRAPMPAERPFKLVSSYEPAGDQPKAIASLADGIDGGERFAAARAEAVCELGKRGRAVSVT